jgi:hypothetical protein
LLCAFFVMGLSLGPGGLFSPLAAESKKKHDGETPAEETVCDPLKADGVTKGLYGLCVAFCEAQDWETDCLEDPEACGRSGERLLSRYEAKRKTDDPTMPCIVSEPEGCPCWNGSDTAVPGGFDLASVWVANAPDNCANTDFCQDQTLDHGPLSVATCIPDSGDAFTTVAFPAGDGFGGCQAQWPGGGTITILLDPETFALCSEQLDNFTSGGTFPFYLEFACGLPFP